MSTPTTPTPPAPRLAQGGILVMDPTSGDVTRTFALQYNPESVSRSFQPVPGTTEGRDRSEALRLTGPAVETIRVEVEIDATDWLDRPTANVTSQLASQYGLLPQLAILESLLSPTVQSLKETNSAADQGVLEISATEAPLTVFVWNRRRTVPVRITELAVVEDIFDTSLNPIRVRVTLTMRVLSTSDLPWQHPGTNVFLQHLAQQALLADQMPAGTVGDVGLTARPGT